ncbi:hypothetical protein Pmani_001276 [Petrolisthes manimaculis]|uniref:Cytochrome P450 n=1 Tax=Petrolisthes manimaculis TaxID=1843537 RepID=A0AAE1ULI1_9EUCA|nr:hypothetical protein Pmani_001276 [Petrolisthes manimaculis]
MLVEVVLLVAVVLMLLKVLRKPHGLPPGRWGLPLVGYVPLTRKNIEDQLMDLHKKHGDIYTWRMGTQVFVFLHDYRLTREAFMRPEFVDRPDWLVFKFKEEKSLGVLGSNGSQWHNNRRFSLRQLRDLGMGKSKLVAAVHTQARQLVQELRKQADQPAKHLPIALSAAIMNIIWNMVASRQFEMDDPRAIEFKNILDQLIEAEDRSLIVDLLPWLRTLLPEKLINWIIKMDVIDTTRHKFLLYFKEVVEEHRATLDPNNPRDLIDGYLMEMEERKEDLDSTFNEADMYMLILDLFAAGTSTTTDTMTFIMQYLAVYPKVQRKLQDEVDRVLRGHLPTLEDRSRLPYTEAVIHEVLRKSSLASVGVQHVATKDTFLAEYVIPKGTVIHSVAVSIHHDKRYWEEPHVFKPERWIDHQGHFTATKEGFLPFGVGKRQCVGEGLARMELFIFTVAVFQSLNLASPPGSTINPTHDPNIPIFHMPTSQPIHITSREPVEVA